MGFADCSVNLVTAHKACCDSGSTGPLRLAATMSRTSQRPAGLDPVVTDLIDKFDLDEVADRIVAGILPDVPAYARMPEGLMLGEVRQIVRHNLELFVTCLLEDREPDESELAVLRASAVQRGREGVPLQDMLHGYQLGARAAWQTLIELAADERELSVLVQVAGRVMRYLDGVSTAVSASYLDEREHLVSERERWARALLDAVLEPSSGVEELQRLADKTGFALAAQYRPFALAVPGAAAREHSRIAIDLRSRGILALTEGDRVSGLTQAVVDATALAGTGVTYAIGEPTGRRQLGPALDFARMQVQTARSVGRTGAVRTEDLLPELLLARSPELADMLHAKVLGPLEVYAEKRSPELLHTLVAFVECGLDRRTTTERLHIHTNTLDYRLRRIEQLIGLQLARQEDLVLIVLALKQRVLAGPR